DDLDANRAPVIALDEEAEPGRGRAHAQLRRQRRASAGQRERAVVCGAVHVEGLVAVGDASGAREQPPGGAVLEPTIRAERVAAVVAELRERLGRLAAVVAEAEQRAARARR